MKKIVLFLLLILCAFTVLEAQIRYDAEPPCAGMQIHPAADILYVTCGNELAAFNIAVPDQPVLTSKIHLAHFPQSLALDVKNNVLYVADSMAVRTVDISKADQLKMTDKVYQAYAASPVDVLMQKDSLWVAGRRGGLLVKKDDVPVRSPLLQSSGSDWVRAVSALDNGGLAICTLDAVHLSVPAWNSKVLQISVPVGTPRRVRAGIKPGTLYVANGFCGYGRIVIPTEKDAAKDHSPAGDYTAEWTENLNRFSTYGSYVYDVMEWQENVLLLAAGEIGVVTVVNGKLKSDCPALNWGHVNGLIRGKGNRVYAVDQLSGLCVLDVSDPEKIKLTKRIKILK